MNGWSAFGWISYYLPHDGDSGGFADCEDSNVSEGCDDDGFALWSVVVVMMMVAVVVVNGRVFGLFPPDLRTV